MKISKRRKREGKTDYSRRIKMLKGEFPRVVFRKTNRYVIAQYVISKEAKDEVKFELSSKKLLSYGWAKEARGSLKSIPAYYLIGFLIGKKIVSNKLKNPIADFGMYRVLSKSNIQAFIKGLVDSGVKIAHKKESFPPEERIRGGHLKNKISFEEIKSKIEKTTK